MSEFLKKRWQRLSPLSKVAITIVVTGNMLVAALSKAARQQDATLPSEYAVFFGLDAGNKADAGEDLDGDGLSNLAEAGLWTDPREPDTDCDRWPDNADTVPRSRMYVRWGDPTFTHGDEYEYAWPEWAVGAFKRGGEWVSGVQPGWHAEAGADAALNIEVDRAILTTDAVLLLAFLDHKDSSLLVDLYDKNGQPLCRDVCGNILRGTDAPATVLLDVPFEQYPGAVGIRIRCEKGRATVFESLLYADEDGDGLDIEQEKQLGTSDSTQNHDDTEPVILDSAASSSSHQPAAVSAVGRAAKQADIESGMETLLMGEGGEGEGSGAFTNWQYRMRIEFDGYTKPETLTNFPMLVVFGTNMTGFSYSQFASTNGWDLRFSDWDGSTELNCEIEKWDTNGNSWVWVQVPAVEADHCIWAYWGNPDETSRQPYTTNGATWDSNYRAVWHIAEGGTGTRYDSTVNDNDCAPQNYDGDEASTGKIDGADYLDGVNDALKANDNSTLDLTTVITCEAWINSERWDNDNVFIRKENAYRFYNRWDDVSASHFSLKLKSSPDDEINYPITYLPTGQWHYVVGTYDKSLGGNNMRLYLNGVLVTSKVSTVTANSTADSVYVGMKSGGTQMFKGVMDEARLSAAARSSNWVWACFMNQGSNSLFNACSAVQTNWPAINNAEGASDVTGCSATLNGNLVSTGGLPTAVFLYWGDSDGGDEKGSWDNCVELGTMSAGAVSNSVSGLDDQATYYYRFYATNAAADSWSAPSASFITLLDTTAFSYGAKIVFSGYTKTETLTNFPMLLVFGTNLPGFAYTQFASPDGWDLRIQSSDGTTLLNYQIEKWDTNGDSHVWVQAPAVSGTNTCVWAYWGNTNSACTSAPAVYTTNGATWDANYKAVWHMAEGGTGTRYDSTANDNDCAPQNYDGDEAATGKIDGADYLDGVNDALKATDNATLDLTTAITAEAWINSERWDADNVFIRKESAYRFYNRWDDVSASHFSLKLKSSPDDEINYPITYLPTGQWHHVVGTYDKNAAGNNLRLYLNGVLVTSKVSTVTANSTSDDVYIGIKAGGTQMFKGVMDEARLSGTTRSSNWVWTCFMNQGSNSSFNAYSVGELDSDGDGLANWKETGTGIYGGPDDTGTDPGNADSDGDGTNDGDEVEARTDPNNDDTTSPAVTITFPANSYEGVCIP